MKKLIFLICVFVSVAILLIAAAFLFFYLHIHKIYLYDIFYRDQIWGDVKVDRYNTEGKIIYKSEKQIPYSTEFSRYTEKYFIDKNDMETLKFSLEGVGEFGQKESIVFERENLKQRYLYLKHPEFFKKKEPILNAGTPIFLPDSILSYMVVLEKYNFWKKGVQYMDIVIPVKGAMAPVRTRLEVRHLGDHYVSIQGRKIEAEMLSFYSEIIPESKVFMAKYSHKILMIKMNGRELKWMLKNPEEGAEKFFSSFQKKIFTGVRATFRNLIRSEDRRIEKIKKKKIQKEKENFDIFRAEKSEVFFKSENLVLSGELYKPKGNGPFVSLIIVPRDGPLTNGDKEMLESLCFFLSDSGYACLFFQRPGQGKSQGVFPEMDDEDYIRNIVSASQYITAFPWADKDSVVFIADRGGGYPALKAAKNMSAKIGCILLNPVILSDVDEYVRNNIKAMLEENALVISSSEKIEEEEKELKVFIEDVFRFDDKVAYFAGFRLPYDEYKSFLSRKTEEEITNTKNPVLIVSGKNNPLFSQSILERLRNREDEQGLNVQVSVFRALSDRIGFMRQKEGRWVFDLNKDVLNVIDNWIKDKYYTRDNFEDKSSDPVDEINAQYEKNKDNKSFEQADTI